MIANFIGDQEWTTKTIGRFGRSEKPTDQFWRADTNHNDVTIKKTRLVYKKITRSIFTFPIFNFFNFSILFTLTIFPIYSLWIKMAEDYTKIEKLGEGMLERFHVFLINQVINVL